MPERAVAAAMRAIRLELRLTQREVSLAAAVPRSVIQQVERDRLERVRVGDLRRIAGALDASVDLGLRWRGGDLPRLVNARHAALHEAVAERFAMLPEWLYEPEVSFSRWGERGIVDGIGWHPSTRSLVVHELKSQIVDPSELMGTADRKRRLAADIVRERDWHPATVSLWIVVADTRTNRRALARHERALRAKFPADGHAVAAWLRRPIGRLDALSFLPIASSDGRSNSGGAARLVRRPREPLPEP
jgi:transcriptional regulator with XRE-family HTH domain